MNDSVKLYDKLVRDGIGSILKQKGLEFKIHKIPTDLEYKKRLFDKLREESNELFNNPDSVEEFADIIEVIRSLKPFFPGWEERAEQKRKERGGFSGRTVLEYVRDSNPPDTIKDSISDG